MYPPHDAGAHSRFTKSEDAFWGGNKRKNSTGGGGGRARREARLREKKLNPLPGARRKAIKGWGKGEKNGG